MEAQEKETKQVTDFQAMWEAYEFDTTQPLLTKDVYAFLGKGGNAEFISQKMSELSGQTINIPPRIKNQDLWNNFVKPFRELPQEKQTELKNALVGFLQNNQEEIQQEQKEQTNGKKMEDFADFYGNQYEIRADKSLNKHDILAFSLQYGKGAKEKLLELLENFLEKSVEINSFKTEELIEKIINPINNKGVFASTEFKNLLIENVEQQKAFKEEQALENMKNLVLYNKKEKELFFVQINEENKIEMKGVDSPLGKNDFQKSFSLEEWNLWKQEHKDAFIQGQSQKYDVGQEFVFNFEGKQEVFTLTHKRENAKNPLWEKLYFSNGINEHTFYKFDVDLFIGQNIAKQVTLEMKEKGILFEKDFEKFHLEHLAKMNPNTGLTDKNIYAILNIKLSEPLANVRKELMEKYFNIPFDDLKKLKKEDMIQKVYGIKKGENKDIEFELKSEIQKLFLASKGEMNFQATEPYQKYLEVLEYPADKKVWELEHIDKFLTQETSLTELVEGTPLENDKKCMAILKNFEEEGEFVIFSKSFHMGEYQIQDKQYLLNAFNHSLDKEQIRNQILENIAEQKNGLTFQQKR